MIIGIKKDTTAILHQGRYRQATKLSNAVSTMETINFMLLIVG
jgi:hypothetical protein